MLISEAFAAYAADVIIFTNQSSKTEEYHNNALKCLLRSLGEDIDVAELKFEHVRQWKIDMVKQGKKNSTIREYIMKLRVVLKYLNKRGFPSLDYESVALPKREVSVPSFITKEEVAHLIKEIGKKRRGYPDNNRLRNVTIVSMLFGSGVRISELCRLDRDSIVNDTFTAVGKTGPRVAFIDRRTKELLRQYLETRTDNNPALFLNNQTGTRISPGGIQQMMRDGWKKAGFTRPIHPHTLRHSHATNLLINNCNLRYVQALLGHSSLETTKVYTHVMDEDLKAVHARYMKI